jgi:hypothetical protein
MASWPNHLPSSNQKRFWRDPVKRRYRVNPPLHFISLCHCRLERKKTESTHMKPQKTTIAILVRLSAFSIALPDDFKTHSGKEYKNVTVTQVEPGGIVVKTKSGILKVYFTELPNDVQERFGYDAAKAAQFTNAAQAAVAQSNAAARDAEVQRQQEAQERQRRIASDIEQRQRQEAAAQPQAEWRQQVETRRTAKSPPSVSKEGVREHTYELLQDYTIERPGWSKRVRRGERYHGRILVDHAEIDIGGFSYTVPSGILSAPKD